MLVIFYFLVSDENDQLPGHAWYQHYQRQSHRAGAEKQNQLFLVVFLFYRKSKYVPAYLVHAIPRLIYFFYQFALK